MREYDPYAYEIHENPYPVYAELRRHAPVYRNERLEFWALSRHADVHAAFRDSQRFSNRNGVSLDPAAANPGATATMSFLAMDPPRHTRMRALVSRAFTPRRVQDLEPRIRELARRYTDRVLEQGRCDFIGDFAGKLPMDVISEMLGVPAADRAQLRTWADMVVHREEGSHDLPASAFEASANLFMYFQAMVAERRISVRDDLTGALLTAEIDGDRLSDTDVIAFLFLLIIAGNETTTKLLGNALYWLWRNPGQRRLVEHDPSKIPAWVEETLRYDPSSQALARTLSEDVTLRGVTMREGDRVVLLIGAANRDELVFPEPDRFDVERNTSASLSFGYGTHYCLGASLARLEGRVALEELCARISGFEIETSGIVRVHSVNVRGFAVLPVELSPRRHAA
jgi:hypothetical protein